MDRSGLAALVFIVPIALPMLLVYLKKSVSSVRSLARLLDRQWVGPFISFLVLVVSDSGRHGHLFLAVLPRVVVCVLLLCHIKQEAGCGGVPTPASSSHLGSFCPGKEKEWVFNEQKVFFVYFLFPVLHR